MEDYFKTISNILILISLITLLNIGIRLLFVVAVFLDRGNDQSTTNARLHSQTDEKQIFFVFLFSFHKALCVRDVARAHLKLCPIQIYYIL